MKPYPRIYFFSKWPHDKTFAVNR